MSSILIDGGVGGSGGDHCLLSTRGGRLESGTKASPGPRIDVTALISTLSRLLISLMSFSPRRAAEQQQTPLFPSSHPTFAEGGESGGDQTKQNCSLYFFPEPPPARPRFIERRCERSRRLPPLSNATRSFSRQGFCFLSFSLFLFTASAFTPDRDSFTES